MGTDISNYTSRLLDTDKLTSDKEFNIKWSAASLYAGMFIGTNAMITILIRCDDMQEAQIP